MVKILLERRPDMEACRGQYNRVLEAASAGEDQVPEKPLQRKGAK